MRTRLAARPLPRRDWDWETSCSNYVGLGPEPSSIGIILINCPNPGLRIFSTILISLGKVCPFQVPYVFRESSPVPFKNRMCIMNGPSAMKRQGAGLVARRKVPPTIQYISPLALKRSVDCPFRLAVEDVAKFSHRKRGPCVQVSCPSRGSRVPLRHISQCGNLDDVQHFARENKPPVASTLSAYEKARHSRTFPIVLNDPNLTLSSSASSYLKPNHEYPG